MKTYTGQPTWLFLSNNRYLYIQRLLALLSGAPRGVSWLPGNPPKSVKKKYCIVINFEKREGERVT